MGLGLLGGGVGVAKLFAEIGAQVTVTDLKKEKELTPSLKKLRGLGIKLILGQHREKDFQKADLVIRNPAVPRESQWLQIARRKGIPVVMDTSLFAKFCDRPLIGVTGTRGKTTTATLIYELLKGSGKNALFGGNVKGIATLPLLKKIQPNTLVVLELSSWQLQGFDEEKISPYIGVVTNIYPDHLNRYPTMTEYIKDKKIIFKYQTKNDFLVLNRENNKTKEMASEAKAKVVWFRADDFPREWPLALPGKHNRANAAAAYRVGEIVKLYPQWMKSVFATFRGVAFRLEAVGEVKGVKYINDSTSTIPEATIAALETIDEPIILLAGGASKNLDFAALAKKIAVKTKAVVLLEGSATVKLASSINRTGVSGKIIGRFGDLKKAVLTAQKAAQRGDVVLLSPGCASFGMFKNEYHRGEEFNQIVKNLCLN